MAADPNSLENIDEATMREAALLVRDLANNPETATSFLPLVKKARPQQFIPQVDIGNAVRNELEAERKKREKLEDEMLRNEVERKRNDTHSRLKAKRGYSDEDIAAVEKLIVERKIGDYETAADFYDFTRKAAVPTSDNIRQSSTYSMPDKDKWFKGNLNKTAVEEAHKALEEAQKMTQQGIKFG